MTNNVKVEQYYNKNQFIIYCKGEIYLQSYESTVAVIKTDHTLTLGRDWDYSNTTRKHLYLFIKEYGLAICEAEREPLKSALNSTNIKKAIQSLIDNNIISFNPDLGEE